MLPTLVPGRTDLIVDTRKRFSVAVQIPGRGTERLTILERAKPEDLQKLESFLVEISLPTVGLRDCCQNFFIAMDERGLWSGIAGYELYNRSALLRSVAVRTDMRGQGCGQTLVEAVLEDMRKRGVRNVYLLTETAESYFKRLGFESITRDRLPQEVKKSAEFSECCSTAQAMLKIV